MVLVWRYDRFARSTQAAVNALSEFRSLGVDSTSFQEYRSGDVGGQLEVDIADIDLKPIEIFANCLRNPVQIHAELLRHGRMDALPDR